MNTAVLDEIVRNEMWIDVSAFADLPVNRGCAVLWAASKSHCIGSLPTKRFSPSPIVIRSAGHS